MLTGASWQFAVTTSLYVHARPCVVLAPQCMHATAAGKQPKSLMQEVKSRHDAAQTECTRRTFDMEWTPGRQGTQCSCPGLLQPLAAEWPAAAAAPGLPGRGPPPPEQWAELLAGGLSSSSDCMQSSRFGSLSPDRCAWAHVDGIGAWSAAASIQLLL